jgi:hypothetical protein
VAKDRARPFSPKHRRYWIPVTGGMIALGLLNVVIGYCSYTTPSDKHEQIQLGVPNAAGVADAAAPFERPTSCPPAIVARIEAEMPGATLTACAPDRVALVRGDHTIELEVAGSEIRSVAESLKLPEIPADVMRAFAVAFPRTIPASALKRTRKGAEPIYELGFPPGREHALVLLRGDGTIVETR